MVNTEENTITKFNAGVPETLMSYRFYVDGCVSSQVSGVEIDFVKKIVKMDVLLNVFPESFHNIMKFTQSSSLIIHLINSLGKTVYSIELSKARIISHDFGLSYASTSESKSSHKMVWEYQTVNLIEP